MKKIEKKISTNFKASVHANTLLSREIILRRIQATKEHFGLQMWPKPKDKARQALNDHVYDKDPETGELKHLPDEKWTKIETACQLNLRGLKNAGSFESMIEEIDRPFIDAQNAAAEKRRAKRAENVMRNKQKEEALIAANASTAIASGMQALQIGDRLKDGTVVIYIDMLENTATFAPRDIFSGRSQPLYMEGELRRINEKAPHGHMDWRTLTTSETHSLVDAWRKVASPVLLRNYYSAPVERFWGPPTSHKEKGSWIGGGYESKQNTNRPPLIPVVRSGARIVSKDALDPIRP
jgi:hypothetical protein